MNAGNPEAALLTYFRRDPRVSPAYFDAQLFGSQLDGIDCLTTSAPFYFVAREQQTAGLGKYLTPLTTITNPYNSDYHTIYTLVSPCTGPSLPFSLTLTQP